MLESDNNVDTLLFVIENTCRVIVDKSIVNKKTACLGDLFFMSDGVYWIEYVSLADFFKETSSRNKGALIGGIAGGFIGSVLGSAQDMAIMEKIEKTGFDSSWMLTAMAQASGIRDGQYGFSISERLKQYGFNTSERLTKPRSKSTISFSKSMKREDIQTIDFSPSGAFLTFTLAHDVPFKIYTTTGTDNPRGAVKKYMSNESMETANDARYGFLFSAVSPSRLIEMLAERTPVEEQTLNRVARDETYMKRFYALLYKQKKVRRMAICDSLSRQVSMFRDALMKTCSAASKKKMKSGIAGTLIASILLMVFVILIANATNGEEGVVVYAISLSVCVLIIFLGAVRPARKAKNMLMWLQQ